MPFPVLIIVAAGLILFVVLHLKWYIRPDPVESLADLEQRVSQGKPVIVEFYSNL